MGCLPHFPGYLLLFLFSGARLYLNLLFTLTITFKYGSVNTRFRSSHSSHLIKTFNSGSSVTLKPSVKSTLIHFGKQSSASISSFFNNTLSFALTISNLTRCFSVAQNLGTINNRMEVSSTSTMLLLLLSLGM